MLKVVKAKRSTGTPGRAPACTDGAPAVAMKCPAAVITSSPGRHPEGLQREKRASVPVPHPDGVPGPAEAAGKALLETRPPGGPRGETWVDSKAGTLDVAEGIGSESAKWLREGYELGDAHA